MKKPLLYAALLALGFVFVAVPDAAAQFSGLGGSAGGRDMTIFNEGTALLEATHAGILPWVRWIAIIVVVACGVGWMVTRRAAWAWMGVALVGMIIAGFAEPIVNFALGPAAGI